MNGDRHREIAYHDLERIEDEQALLLRGAVDADEPSGQQGTMRSSPMANGPVRRGWTPSLHLTTRELEERWPLG